MHFVFKGTIINCINQVWEGGRSIFSKHCGANKKKPRNGEVLFEFSLLRTLII
jgi:hypothetical protein